MAHTGSNARPAPKPRWPGEGWHNARFTAAQVIGFRERYAAGVGPSALAREAGIGKSYMCNILWGSMYRHVPGGCRRLTKRQNVAAHTRGERHGRARLGVKDVLAIRTRYAAGESILALAAAYCVAHGTVCDIVSRRNWKHV